jgi:hypothetical protein
VRSDEHATFAQHFQKSSKRNHLKSRLKDEALLGCQKSHQLASQSGNFLQYLIYVLGTWLILRLLYKTKSLLLVHVQGDVLLLRPGFNNFSAYMMRVRVTRPNWGIIRVTRTRRKQQSDLQSSYYMKCTFWELCRWLTTWPKYWFM